MTRYIVVLYLMSHSLVVFLYRLLDRLKILNGIKFRIFNYCRLFAYPVGFLIRHFSFIVHYCISSKPLKTTAYAIKVVLISCTYLPIQLSRVTILTSFFWVTTHWKRRVDLCENIKFILISVGINTISEFKLFLNIALFYRNAQNGTDWCF